MRAWLHVLFFVNLALAALNLWLFLGDTARWWNLVAPPAPWGRGRGGVRRTATPTRRRLLTRWVRGWRGRPGGAA